MGIFDDPCESKRSNTDPSTDLLRSAVAEVPLTCLWPGTPIEVIEAQSTIPIPADLLRKNNIYVLRVRGDSMIGDHLLDGDHLIVEKLNSAKDGELVLVLTSNSEATLKRFHDDGRRIRMERADASSEAMFHDEKDVAIQGVVVGILRKYRS
ncbi:MAG: LexA family protein [Desulfomonilaceae bacterium]